MIVISLKDDMSSYHFMGFLKSFWGNFNNDLSLLVSRFIVMESSWPRISLSWRHLLARFKSDPSGQCTWSFVRGTFGRELRCGITKDV